MMEGPPGEAVEGVGAGAVCGIEDAAVLAARPDTWTGWGAVCTKLWAVGKVEIGVAPERTRVVAGANGPAGEAGTGAGTGACDAREEEME